MKLTVADVMTQPVITVTPQATFKEAVSLLRRRRVSGLPVVDENGRLVGIISEADFLNKVERRDSDAYVLESRQHRLDRARAAALDVASAMSREVTTVRPDVPVALAAREMHMRGFKRLPIVDQNGRLVGIVSRADLLKVFLRTDREVSAEVLSTLGSAERRMGGRSLKATVADGVVHVEGRFETKSRLEAALRAIAAIDGVVGVNSKANFDVDDNPPSIYSP